MTPGMAAHAGPPLRAVPPAAWIDEVASRRRSRRRATAVAHHRPAVAREAVDTRVGLVVITHNRRAEVVATLHRLADLPERPPVIVVDNASTDGTAAVVVTAHPWAEVVALDRNAGAEGRNAGVDLLATPYVAFADDDTWWAPGSLRGAADLLDRHPDVAVVTATIITEPAGVEDPVVHDMRVSPLPDEPGMPGHPLLSVLAGASMVRRAAFQQVGGFEPRFWIGGEEELLSADLAAAGWALRHAPELVVHHAASRARDPHRRRADGIRNTLWFSWLRRPWSDAGRRSWHTLRTAPRDRVTAIAIAMAVAGIPWVLRERRRLPAAVAEGLRLLDHQQLHSPARRYVS